MAIRSAGYNFEDEDDDEDEDDLTANLRWSYSIYSAALNLSQSPPVAHV
jgi:hypothetical protein